MPTKRRMPVRGHRGSLRVTLTLLAFSIQQVPGERTGLADDVDVRGASPHCGHDPGIAPGASSLRTNFGFGPPAGSRRSAPMAMSPCGCADVSAAGQEAMPKEKEPTLQRRLNRTRNEGTER